jgi:polyhydroxybutyrate depolymerase
MPTTHARETAYRPRGLAIKRAALFILLGLCAASALLLAGAYVLTSQATGWIVSSGQRRSYLLHAPPNYDPITPVPLVVSLHGFAEWPAHLRDISRWNGLADQHGFIVVYPAGAGFPRRWQAGGGALGSGEAMRDVTFIADLIAYLRARYSIDATRIYVNGFSNGGGMAYLLACQLADRIAAAGGVAGAYLYPPDACRPHRPVPFIAFHGTADPLVPYDGGRFARFDHPFPAVPDWVAAWAGRNGCNPIPVPLPGRGKSSGRQYTNCRDEADVIFYTIEGGGHTWPGGAPMPRLIVGRTTRDLDATAAMWAFFSRYALPIGAGAPIASISR